MVPELKLRQLRAALAVAGAGSALKAAGEVKLSAPAVLGAVSALETALGTALFERTPRGMVPNPAGVLFCRRIEAGLGQLRAAEAEIAPHRRFAGRISHVHLRALLVLLESDGFSTAARRLGLSQPALHRTARELEALVGCTLWRRQGRVIHPTPEAVRLGYRAGLLLSELRMGVDELGELAGRMTGRLCVGALPLARSKWLPHALALTLARYPMAEVSIMDGPYEEQLDALLRGRLDVILGTLRLPAPSPDIVQERLFEDSLSIVVRAGHPLAVGFDSARDKLRRGELAELSWILPPKGTPARENFAAFMAGKGVAPPPRVVECNSLVAIRALLLETDHAAVLSARQVEYELGLGHLKIMGPPLTGSAQPVGIATRAGFRSTRLCGAFLETVRTVAASL
ncbi:transcriptional regulator [Acidocella aquatica]|uniref:Transcriptional regulator n=1 Tax=Acidocella aquatica TaxID=1922313 RepID=A0ABQ6A2Z9_9PROT|nr:LysR substrate-binding domain-containing protein [Acidocella aquatica]GLR66161.1 transcriptional regulator [Acidocella aquatica]